MNTFSERLAWALTEIGEIKPSGGLKQANLAHHLARHLNISTTAARARVSYWLAHATSQPMADVTPHLASFFAIHGLPVRGDWLSAGKLPRLHTDRGAVVTTHEIRQSGACLPVLSEATLRSLVSPDKPRSAQGAPDLEGPPAGSLETVFVLNDISPRGFAARVSGDAMAPLGLRDQDVIAVDPTIEAQHGDVVLAVRRVDGAPLFRQLTIEAGTRLLAAADARYPTIAATDAEILGVATELASRNLRRR